MAYQKIFLLALLITVLSAAASAQKPSTDGFITIDCGYNQSSSYTDSITGIVFSSDEPYTSTGVNFGVSSDTNLTGVNGFYATVRSFPDGARNCYTLQPVLSGSKYRITAEFFYGNYDGLRRPPTFDLHLGVNLWTTVDATLFRRKEIITIATSDSIQVCLVNTGRGTPFISELDLRPLPFTAYKPINDTLSSAVIETDRINYGAQKQIGFPDDIYGRGWYPASAGISISTNESIKPLPGSEFPMPEVVLQTASLAQSLTDKIEITVPGKAEDRYYVYMYFTELQVLGNETREFTIYENGVAYFKSYRPTYLLEDLIYPNPPGRPGGVTYSIQATTNATLPPIINALEIFTTVKTPLLPTAGSDVGAILELKNLVQGKKNWEGDPCAPKEFIWKGLGCEIDASNYWRITSLDLSRSGLSGSIPQSIANLTSLTSLDLSFNHLSGEIPNFLGELPSLKTLNLAGNNLSGPVPQSILDKLRSESLALRINDNPIICSSSDLCTRTASQKGKSAVSIAIGVAVAVLVLVAIVVTVLILKRRRTRNHQTVQSISSQQTGNSTPHAISVERGLHTENKQFSKGDIIKITRNFIRPIGKGGFGTVYHGVLDDGTEVAVKLVSSSSVNGERQFKAEAELLTRVHHRYLVTLLGYCNENMALVYEYVPQGTLAEHLSGGAANRNILSWNDRLRIALEAAQGLDYLHYGCKPPIVHRDVKPANFLLTEKLEVKIADFGLSRSRTDERNTFASTVVAGTLGYLDPEYQQTYVLSEASDVYSFGVVLLELITGKAPINNSGNMMTHISTEVKSKMERGDLAQIVDPRLQANYDVNSMWRVIEIALSCTSLKSSHRATTSDVASQLKECLTTETSREFSSGVGSGTFGVYPEYSTVNARPEPR